MNERLAVRAIALVGMVIGLYGCGTGVGSPNGRSVAADSAACVDCHSKTHAYSKVTGEKIVDEWKTSRHAFMNAAGCNDCHETNAQHGGSGTCSSCHGGGTSVPTVPADANGKCYKCHGTSFPEDIMMAKAPQHFNAYTAVSKNRFTNTGPASYVSEQLVGKCRACHNPHDPTTVLQYNRYWAQGGMADVNAGARTGVQNGNYNLGRDFKVHGTTVPANLAYVNSSPTYANFTGAAALAVNLDPNKNVDKFGNVYTPVCVRCHTTTGYINFVESGFKTLAPFGTGTSKEVTDCRACHVDYNYKKTRNVGAVKLYYNYSANRNGNSVKIQNIATQYPEFGKSNMCVPCHSGRGAGDIIKRFPAGFDFSNAASPSAHDFAGAGTIAGLTGYHFDGREYVLSPAQHETIGMSGSGTIQGPCITCHMNTANRPQSHLFQTIEHGVEFATYTTVNNITADWPYSTSRTGPGALTVSEVLSRTCSNYACHVGTGTSTVTPATLNVDKLGYISALTTLNRWLAIARGANSNTNWVFPNFSTQWAPDSMGANFNLGLLNNEAGAYVHRPVYVKRLIFDSIAHLARKQYPAKDGPAVFNAIKDLNNTGTAVAASRRLPVEITNAALVWLFGQSTNAAAAKRPGDN